MKKINGCMPCRCETNGSRTYALEHQERAGQSVAMVELQNQMGGEVGRHYLMRARGWTPMMRGRSNHDRSSRLASLYNTVVLLSICILCFLILLRPIDAKWLHFSQSSHWENNELYHNESALYLYALIDYEVVSRTLIWNCIISFTLLQLGDWL